MLSFALLPTLLLLLLLSSSSFSLTTGFVSMKKRASSSTITQFFTARKVTKSSSSVIHFSSKKSSDVEETFEPITPSPSPSHDWAPLNGIRDPLWRDFILKESLKPYFKDLISFLKKEEERKKGSIFPPAEEIFTAFSLCPMRAVKVVVLGQDPYHGEGQAHGLAFSVKRGAALPLPPSLRNILAEIQRDEECVRRGAKVISGCGNLENWSRQGVLLLNTCLTGEQYTLYTVHCMQYTVHTCFICCT